MVARQKIDLIVIVGPTASGKSRLALKLASEFNGEIIAADSRTIYKGMDIGTAKPTKSEQRAIPHWGLDLIKPGEVYNASKFKHYAVSKISEIKERGHLPILVGGTGLYVDAVLFDFSFVSPQKGNETLDNLSITELKQIIDTRGYPMPVNESNRRHLINTIKRKGKVGHRQSQPPSSTLLVGLLPKDNLLQASIAERSKKMFNAGVVNEAADLFKKYGQTAVQSTGGIVYKICGQLIAGEIKAEKALELFQIADWQYARRQRTWFKRNKFIQWFEDAEEAFTAVADVLNNQSRISSS